jgi:hypothetical protein
MQQQRYCWKRCLLFGPCKGVIRRIIEARIGSLKGAVVQRGLERGSRERAIVRNRYQEMSSEDNVDWKRLSVCCSDL